ncbi:MAG: hypothetical protein ACD_11C00103G0058 [uncultured bacterium]|nr:MAG: hypothetical protein ACD_11C00103G0058 [uncultured bacterium]HBR71204.1 hypothetical protein [Candidatus Moranbacteria bacterium]
MKDFLYLFPFFVSFSVSSILLFLLVFLKKNISEKRISERHIHKNGISRMGGAAIILAFVATLILDKNLFISNQLWIVIIASLAILVFGIWDDLQELNWKKQIFFQLMIVIFIFIMGIRVEYITNPFGGVFDLGIKENFLPSLLFMIVWIIVFMNSMNWVDGIDGLSGGITLIGAATIFLLSIKPEVNQPPMGIITVALFGSILAFLIFNFHPAKILAGTSGSMFMGFILAVLAIFAGLKIATTLLVAAIPVVDAFWVIYERIKNKRSIFSPDKRHLHHKLLDLGWSQNKICLFFYIITIVIALVSLNTKTAGKSVAIFSVIFIVSAIISIIRKKVYVVEEK